jgi:5-formyltetrahydrofolate cyclo-ligase
MAPTCICRPVRIHIPTAMAVPPTLILRCIPAPMTVADLKKAMREHTLAARGVIKEAQPDAARRMAENFLKSVPLARGDTVSVYIAIGDEADPSPLIDALRKRGHVIALPRVAGKGKPLAFHRYDEAKALVPGVFGLSQPAQDWPEAVPDVLVVPLLAFDAQGNRLGYGAGFYDRTLQGLRARRSVVAVGYAFARQEMAEVPHDEGDERLDMVVTEHGVRNFTKSRV